MDMLVPGSQFWFPTAFLVLIEPVPDHSEIQEY